MRSLETRLAALESLATAAPAPRPDEAVERAKLDRLISRMNTVSYNDWRHASLSLEELLALARDDGRYARANPIAKWSPGHRQHQQGQWIDFWPDVGARELEIRILERDGRIDQATARALRDNLREHFLENTATLHDLPALIEFDEAAALHTARAQCPRRETLPLERQLAIVMEDRERHLLERAATKSDPSQTHSIADLEPLFDRMHAIAVKDLEDRIRERDRLGG